MFARRLGSRTRIAGAAAWLIHVLAGGAWAQTPTRPPETEGAVLQWVIAGGLLIVIGISGFLNPKRSHLN